MGLTSIDDVGEAHIANARRFWWAYTIALSFPVSPQEVKEWDPDEILEALAAIRLQKAYMDKNTPPKEGG
ncbi:hypothetical protein FB479_11671 [Brevibacillus sp. AG162]|nr:hypothetical protein FB479_11671 [Brevibacillus sp. AG162]